jgi:hypothetical protein
MARDFKTPVTINGVTVPTLIGGGAKITVGTTAPSSPATGDIWVDSN